MCVVYTCTWVVLAPGATCGRSPALFRHLVIAICCGKSQTHLPHHSLCEYIHRCTFITQRFAVASLRISFLTTACMSIDTWVYINVDVFLPIMRNRLIHSVCTTNHIRCVGSAILRRSIYLVCNIFNLRARNKGARRGGVQRGSRD